MALLQKSFLIRAAFNLGMKCEQKATNDFNDFRCVAEHSPKGRQARHICRTVLEKSLRPVGPASLNTHEDIQLGANTYSQICFAVDSQIHLSV